LFGNFNVQIKIALAFQCSAGQKMMFLQNDVANKTQKSDDHLLALQDFYIIIVWKGCGY
jgi:hypothetical protein